MQFISNILSPCLYALSFPFKKCRRAHKVMTNHFSFPLTISDHEVIDKNDVRYQTVLTTLPGFHLKDEMKFLLKKERLRQDLVITKIAICHLLPGHVGELGAALGTNLFKNSQTLVVYTPGYLEKDKEACMFNLKHEICHIRDSDNFFHLLIPIIATSTTALLGMYALSPVSTFVLASMVDFSTTQIFALWNEIKADNFAIKNSSTKELLGGRRQFIASKSLHEERHIKDYFISISLVKSILPMRLEINDHPTFTSRIKKIESVLKARGISINHEEENQKIENLKEFFKFRLQSELEEFRSDIADSKQS